MKLKPLYKLLDNVKKIIQFIAIFNLKLSHQKLIHQKNQYHLTLMISLLIYL